MHVKENGRVLKAKEKCVKMPEVDYLDRLLSGLTGLAGKNRMAEMLELQSRFPCCVLFSFVMERGRQWGYFILFTPLLVQNAYSCVK